MSGAFSFFFYKSDAFDLSVSLFFARAEPLRMVKIQTSTIPCFVRVVMSSQYGRQNNHSNNNFAMDIELMALEREK